MNAKFSLHGLPRGTYPVRGRFLGGSDELTILDIENGQAQVTLYFPCPDDLLVFGNEVLGAGLDAMRQRAKQYNAEHDEVEGGSSPRYARLAGHQVTELRAKGE